MKDASLSERSDHGAREIVIEDVFIRPTHHRPSAHHSVLFRELAQSFSPDFRCRRIHYLAYRRPLYLCGNVWTRDNRRDNTPEFASRHLHASPKPRLWTPKRRPVLCLRGRPPCPAELIRRRRLRDHLRPPPNGRLRAPIHP